MPEELVWFVREFHHICLERTARKMMMRKQICLWGQIEILSMFCSIWSSSWSSSKRRKWRIKKFTFISEHTSKYVWKIMFFDICGSFIIISLHTLRCYFLHLMCVCFCVYMSTHSSANLQDNLIKFCSLAQFFLIIHSLLLLLPIKTLKQIDWIYVMWLLVHKNYLFIYLFPSPFCYFLRLFFIYMYVHIRIFFRFGFFFCFSGSNK